MAFRLKSKERVGEGLERAVAREIDKALASLSGSDQGDQAAFEARKRFKKVRAALRLVRDGLGDAVYRRENYLLRDAARPLAEVRDAAMLVEAVDAISTQPAGEIDPRAVDAVRRPLVARRQAVIHRVLDAGGAFAEVTRIVVPVRARVDAWILEDDGWPALGPGLGRVYRAGRRALARAATEPSVENLHEWRKQAKYLWLELQLLEPAWVSREEDLADRIHTLTRLLGEDHDLAVLRDVLTRDPGAYGGHRVLKGLIALIERRRASLEEQAFVLGRGLYADAPEPFTDRIEGYWKAWTPDTGSPPEARVRAERRPAHRESRGRALKTSLSR